MRDLVLECFDEFNFYFVGLHGMAWHSKAKQALLLAFLFLIYLYPSVILGGLTLDGQHCERRVGNQGL